MPTDLPTNRIKKIKLPNNVEYTIVPEQLQSNGYQAVLPELTEDSIIALEGQVITKVGSIEDIPDNELGLFRFTEEVEGVTQSSHIYEVVQEDHGAEEREFYKTTTTNGTQLNDGATFLSHFDSTLSNFISISSLTNVYCFYYNNEVVSRNGIRIGTKNTGRLTLTCTEDGSITFGKYFSYNGSTQVVTYDSGSAVIVDGTKHEFTGSDEDTITINITAGTHTITSNGQDIEGGSAQGRIVLISFEFQGEPYSIYTKHALARVEEVEAVDTKLEQHKTESNIRFAEDERNISKNTGDITDINSRMGDIQVFQAGDRLPYPSQQYLNKIYRFDNKLYQCIQAGEGELKEITFDNVTGTSEVTLSNVEGFITDLDKEDFSTYFYLDYNASAEPPYNNWLKLFRNSGDIRLGSSSSTGNITFFIQDNYIQNLPCTKLKIGFKAYNQNGSSIYIELNSAERTEVYSQFIDNTDTETLVDLSSYLDASDSLANFYIETEATHDVEGNPVNNDKRVIITKLIIEFGTVEYEWTPVSGEDDIVVVEDPTEYTELPTKIYRKIESDGSIRSAYINDIIKTPGTLVKCEQHREENGVDYGQDSGTLIDDLGSDQIYEIFGDNFDFNELNNVSSLYYNQNGEISKGVKFGGNVFRDYGVIGLFDCTPNKIIRVIVGKYFEYDEQGNKVFDEHCVIYSDCFAESPEREITEERQVFEIKTNDNGYFYFNSDGTGLGFGDTRFILYGFEVGEPGTEETIQTNLEIEIVDLTQLNN